LRDIAIAGSKLTDRPARSALGDVQHRHRVTHGLSLPRRAQKFPDATSFKIDRLTA